MANDPMAKRRKGSIVKIVFAVLGIISGVSIFCTFTAFKNVNAAVWGLVSAIFAVLILRLHVAYRKDKLHIKFTPQALRIFKHLGGIGSLAAIVASIVYFSLTVVLKQGYKKEGNGYLPAGIFSFLSLKWTLSLCYFSWKYERLLTEGQEISPIVNGANPT